MNIIRGRNAFFCLLALVACTNSLEAGNFKVKIYGKDGTTELTPGMGTIAFTFTDSAGTAISGVTVTYSSPTHSFTITGSSLPIEKTIKMVVTFTKCGGSAISATVDCLNGHFGSNLKIELIPK